MILDIIGIGAKLIDKLIPDPAQRDAAKLNLLALQQAGELKQIDADIQRETIHAGDRQSARSREVSVRDHTPKVLAYGVTVGFFGILSWMLRDGLPTEGRDAILIMLGALGGAWGSIVSYYFGSSSGSKAKTDALENVASKTK